MTDSPHIDLIRSSLLSSSALYADAAVVRPTTRLVFTAGACPLDESGTTAMSRPVRAGDKHTHRTAGCGATLRDVVKTTVHVDSQDRAELVTAWEMVRRHLGAHDGDPALCSASPYSVTRTNLSKSKRSPHVTRGIAAGQLDQLS